MPPSVAGGVQEERGLLGGGQTVRPLQSQEYERISGFIYEHCGIRLGLAKQALVSSRLTRQIEALGLNTFSKYLDAVLADRSGGLLATMTDLLTTNFTSFFRETAHFTFLSQTLERLAKRNEEIRIWSAACSSGEEPYSIAIAAAETDMLGRIAIEASDISTRVLEKARTGVYAMNAIENLDPQLRRQYFLKGTGRSSGLCRVATEIRSRVAFEQINLTQSLQRNHKYDMIWCRNVMIYFDKATQEGVVGRLSSWLKPSGFLLIGHSEALSGMHHTLQYVQPAVYQKGK